MAVDPPRPKDLPLSALRAFEAAARLGGFAAAAEELGVSPAAITAQVKTLEAAVGVRLFERGPRGVQLTAVGQRVRPGLSEAFDRLRDAMQDLRGSAAERKVHIATLPALAQLWLAPRLPALREALPSIAVSVTAMEAPPALKRHPYDLCLFYGTEARDRVDNDVIFPACAPSLRARLSHPGDLASVPCLSDAAWSGDWAAWAAVALPGSGFVPRGPTFSLYALAVDEAVRGAGVLMAHAALVQPLLDRGALIEPFALRVLLPRALRLWPARAGAARSPAMQVARWLGESAQDGHRTA